MDRRIKQSTEGRPIEGAGFFADEPTQQVSAIAGAFPRQPVGPRHPPAPPKVEARAVIVYEPEPRRRWGLPVLTVVLFSLTVGVVLGQTIAYRPRSGSAAAAQSLADTAGYATPPSAWSPSGQAQPSPVTPTPGIPAPGASGPVPPATGLRVSAPLGSARAQQFEVSGAATQVTVRSADLGDRLFDIATLDGSAAPRVVNLKSGPRLDFVRTGAPGRIGAVIQLNARVKWKLHLTGTTAEREIDMRAGGLAGLDLTGDATRALLRLPIPEGSVALTLSGRTSTLDVQAASGVPIRVKLAKGADSAVLDGTSRRPVTSGTVLTSAGWKAAANRYDITASAKIGTVRIAHA